MRTSQLHKRDTQTPTRYIPNLNIEPWMRVRDRRWVSRYNQLTFIVNRIHRFPTHSEMPSNLSSWVRNQRRTMERLAKWRLNLLRNFNTFSFDPRRNLWEATHRRFWRWQLIHGRAPRRRSTDPLESRLARWGETQRRSLARKQTPYERSVLSRDAIACSQQLSHLPSAYAAYFYAVHHMRFEDRGMQIGAYAAGSVTDILRRWREANYNNPLLH